MVLRYVCSILLALLFTQPITAQPTLLFKRIEVQYPKIRLAYKVTCGGTFRNDLQPQNFEVYENGMLVKNATLWCPPDPDCCVSVALVLDRSGSMAGEKMDNVKNGAKEFIARMNPDGLPCDEAAVVSFEEFVTLDVGMTSNKSQLISAIDAMVPFGWTAVWDATAVGIQELASSGKNRCKAVVLLSDGGDNRSQYFKTVQAVIRFAQTQGVKVYTIGYGLEDDPIAQQNLELLARSTGAQYYYSADGKDIAQIYASIKEAIKEDFKECYIDYETNCPDGTMRTVELVIKDFCGGTASATRTYVAPLDRSKFQPVRLRLGDADVGSTKEVVIPVMLESSVNGIFSKSDVVIGYDRNVLQFVRLSTDGTILEGRAVTYQPYGSSVAVHIDEHIEMNQQPGVLMYLHFRAGDVSSMMYSLVQLINWNFEAYCLYPEMFNGTIKIRPREPELNCVVTVPASLNWNDVEKRYEPNPFDVTVTVYNTGTREGLNVRATLVTDPSAVKLITPQSNLQYLFPRTIPPGGSATATWTLEAVKQSDLDSIGIYFSVVADNFPQFACWDRILIDPALSSAIACDIAAPDTVYFREQYYEPQEFDIQVTAHNIGNGQTKDVRAQLLQDTRFTIIPPASQNLADVLLPGNSASGSFRVRVNPRMTDGYDTLRVNIQGDDTNPAWCYYPVWVQRVRMPEFTLICSTDHDSLVFSDETYDYVPNPFTVRTVAQNIGETYAEDSQIMFVGPEYFTPVGANLREEGTMYIGDSRSQSWTLRALPRNIAGWDTLHFQITGRGGLGKQIVLAECFQPIWVPAVRRPEYVLECSAPDSLRYENNRYSPDPVLTVRISNVGSAVGRGLKPAIVLPAMVSLADGEQPNRYIPVLGIGDHVDLQWRLHPEMRAYDGVYRICTQVVDSIGATGTCCTDMFIPRTENPVLMPSCWSIDTLFISELDGQYLGNPFEVALNLTNVGLGTAENVRATLSVLGSFMQIVSSAEQKLGEIEAGNSVRATWEVKALKRTNSADVPIIITILSDNHPENDCSLTVHVPASQEPILVSDCSSLPEDSLFFDWNTGAYEFPVCTVTYTIRNIGKVRALNVDALLVLPPGVSLLTGESPQKQLSPSHLGPGESASVSWRFTAMRSDDDVVREFRFVARADNASDAFCVDDMFIQGSPRSITMSLPKDVLLRYGQKINIPVTIDRTVGKDLSEYIFRFEYDPNVLHFLGTQNTGSLTALAWVGAKTNVIAPGIVEISDYTTGTPLATDAGTLLFLNVEGIYNDKTSAFSFGETSLHIDSSTAVLNRGVIDVRTVDGNALVTNDCLEPLKYTGEVSLEQNRPNPFNPVTTISFSLSEEQAVRLVVFDVHGRVVRVLTDQLLPEGRHSLHFLAEDLPSGVYLYRLETPRKVEARRMILSR
jgi:hypothetical protein